MALEDLLHGGLGLYMRAPGWMRSGVGYGYGLLPQAWRHGSAYGRFALDARRALTAASWPAIEERLSRTLADAAQVSAYAPYAVMLADTRRSALERLRCLPLLSKADIKRDLGQHIHPGARANRLLKTFTGGSTAEPMAFYLQRHVTRSKETAYIHRMEQSLLGIGRSDWTLSLRGRTVASAARLGRLDGSEPVGGMGERPARLWTTEPIKRHYLFSADHLEKSLMSQYVHALVELGPRFVHAFPSALYPLSRWLEQHPAPDWADQVEGVFLTSENVYAYQRESFRKAFRNARIVEHYGHSERVLTALRTDDAGGYAYCPLYGLPELVDAQGRVIDEPGQLGEIVGTSFDNAVMPFMRYRTGDMGMWARPPGYGESRGLARFVMERIEGRLQEFVVCLGGRLVSITTLGAAHFHQLSRVDAIQFEQREPGKLLLKVVTASPLSEAERMSIERAVESKTQGGCTLRIVEVPDIERTARGKQRMLLQHLDLSGYWGASVVKQEAEDRMLEASSHGDADTGRPSRRAFVV